MLSTTVQAHALLDRVREGDKTISMGMIRIALAITGDLSMRLTTPNAV